MSKKIYISGPITGRIRNNVDAFRDAEFKLRQMGLNPLIPHDLFDHIDTRDYDWEHYMRGCIKAMMDCELVVMLPDWAESKGAVVERKLAEDVKIPVYEIEEYIRYVQLAQA